MTELITFKSIPDMFSKERDGLKPNTLRKVDINDNRFFRLISCIKRVEPYPLIEIRNTETLESFIRQITDVTFWEGYAIISWREI